MAGPDCLIDERLTMTEMHSVADAVRMLRMGASLSMAGLSKRSAVSKPYIQQIENGSKLNPSREVVEALDAALGAGKTLVAFANEDDPMKRRTLFAAIAAVAAGGGEYARLLDGIALSSPGRVGVSDVEAVAQSIQFVTGLDLKYGGEPALGPARSMLSWAVRLLDCDMTDRTRLNLSGAVAALADRVAWANYDAGRDGSARDIYGVALRLAGESGDPHIRAQVLMDASTRHAHGGGYGAAVALLGNSVGQHELAPQVQANVRLTYARHIAQMGSHAEAIENVKRAHDEGSIDFDRELPSWSRPFLGNPGHLSSVAARSYLFAGQYDEAISLFASAIGRLGKDRERGRAYALSLKGLAELRGGYADEALVTAEKLATVDASLKSMRVACHARTFAAELAGYGHRDMAVQIKTFATAAAPG